MRHTGDSVATQFDSPIITLAFDSVLRVRLDVDEADVGKLQVGQRAMSRRKPAELINSGDG